MAITNPLHYKAKGNHVVNSTKPNYTVYSKYPLMQTKPSSNIDQLQTQIKINSQKLDENFITSKANSTSKSINTIQSNLRLPRHAPTDFILSHSKNNRVEYPATTRLIYSESQYSNSPVNSSTAESSKFKVTAASTASSSPPLVHLGSSFNSSAQNPQITKSYSKPQNLIPSNLNLPEFCNLTYKTNSKQNETAIDSSGLGTSKETNNQTKAPELSQKPGGENITASWTKIEFKTIKTPMVIPLDQIEPNKYTNDFDSVAEFGVSIESLTLDLFELAEAKERPDYSQLGQGTFGVVRKMRFRPTGKIYALKSLNKAEVKDSGMLGQLAFEIKVQQSLCHANILRCYTFFEDVNCIHIVLEYCENGDLYTKMKQNENRRFTETDAFYYFSQLVNGLYHMHRNGFIHRDIKLENLLIDNKNTLKIADFGWCGNVLGKNNNFSFCGTLDYLSPEMIQGIGHDWRVDIWDAGIVLYELLVGRPPFQSTQHFKLIYRILNIQISFPKSVKKDAVALIEKFLKFDPDQRIKLNDLRKNPWISRLWKETLEINKTDPDEFMMTTDTDSNTYLDQSSSDDISDRESLPMTEHYMSDPEISCSSDFSDLVTKTVTKKKKKPATEPEKELCREVYIPSSMKKPSTPKSKKSTDSCVNESLETSSSASSKNPPSSRAISVTSKHCQLLDDIIDSLDNINSYRTKALSFKKSPSPGHSNVRTDTHSDTSRDNIPSNPAPKRNSSKPVQNSTSRKTNDCRTRRLAYQCTINAQLAHGNITLPYKSNYNVSSKIDTGLNKPVRQVIPVKKQNENKEKFEALSDFKTENKRKTSDPTPRQSYPKSNATSVRKKSINNESSELKEFADHLSTSSSQNDSVNDFQNISEFSPYKSVSRQVSIESSNKKSTWNIKKQFGNVRSKINSGLYDSNKLNSLPNKKQSSSPQSVSTASSNNGRSTDLSFEAVGSSYNDPPNSANKHWASNNRGKFLRSQPKNNRTHSSYSPFTSFPVDKTTNPLFYQHNIPASYHNYNFNSKDSERNTSYNTHSKDFHHITRKSSEIFPSSPPQLINNSYTHQPNQMYMNPISDYFTANKVKYNRDVKQHITMQSPPPKYVSSYQNNETMNPQIYSNQPERRLYSYNLGTNYSHDSNSCNSKLITPVGRHSQSSNNSVSSLHGDYKQARYSSSQFNSIPSNQTPYSSHIAEMQSKMASQRGYPMIPRMMKSNQLFNSSLENSKGLYPLSQPSFFHNSSYEFLSNYIS